MKLHEVFVDEETSPDSPLAWWGIDNDWNCIFSWAVPLSQNLDVYSAYSGVKWDQIPVFSTLCGEISPTQLSRKPSWTPRVSMEHDRVANDSKSLGFISFYLGH